MHKVARFDYAQSRPLKGTKHPLSSTLTPDEIHTKFSPNILTERDTTSHFVANWKSVPGMHHLPHFHPLLKLASFVNSEGVLRVGGRLKNSLLDPDGKHLSSRNFRYASTNASWWGADDPCNITSTVLDNRRTCSRRRIRTPMCSVRPIRAATAKEMMDSLPTSRTDTPILTFRR